MRAAASDSDNVWLEAQQLVGSSTAGVQRLASAVTHATGQVAAQLGALPSRLEESTAAAGVAAVDAFDRAVEHGVRQISEVLVRCAL